AVTRSRSGRGGVFQSGAVEGRAGRQLGDVVFGDKMRVRKLTNGRNMLCTVCGTRLALSKDLADQIQVIPA
ncbi:MAG: hypothetical protein H8E96_00885, partial [Verrucomicrobiaceae bacterium]|nr:hypothetical protein [Verrucomicrobiaceae bacterium]